MCTRAACGSSGELFAQHHRRPCFGRQVVKRDRRTHDRSSSTEATTLSSWRHGQSERTWSWRKSDEEVEGIEFRQGPIPALRQNNQTWEADFRALPKPIVQGKRTTWEWSAHRTVEEVAWLKRMSKAGPALATSPLLLT